jgi:son of sevenless
MECILRSREQHARKLDNTSALIQSTNLVSELKYDHGYLAESNLWKSQIATWVVDCIICREDSRRRAAVIKHFINVADVTHTLSLPA